MRWPAFLYVIGLMIAMALADCAATRLDAVEDAALVHVHGQ
jgi:hypothetical protein